MKQKIVETIFGTRTASGQVQVDDPKLDAFWSFYMRPCFAAAGRASVQNHQDVLRFVEAIRAGPSRMEARESFRTDVQMCLICLRVTNKIRSYMIR